MNPDLLKLVMPAHFWVTVQVIRGGGRDRMGAFTPGETIDVPQKCLIAPGGTGDAQGPATREASSSPTLYLPHLAGGRTVFVFEPGDTIVVPEGQWMSGSWQVDGRPKNWPVGWEVRLRQDSGGPA